MGFMKARRMMLGVSEDLHQQVRIEAAKRKIALGEAAEEGMKWWVARSEDERNNPPVLEPDVAPPQPAATTSDQ